MSSENRGLSERKKQILKAIVDAHIEGGEPVGSKYILQSKHINCSSATIRNEMAELEEMGYLEQPHASAGRVPSELGYRFYVDALIERYAMTTNEIAQINALLKAKMGELDQILLAASNLASTMTNYTGIAIKPKLHSVSVEKFETIYLDPDHIILVAVDSDGNVIVKDDEMITDEQAKAIENAEHVLYDTRSDDALKVEADYIKAKSYLASSRRDEAFEVMERLAEDVSGAYGAECAFMLIQDCYDRGAFEDVETKVYAFADAESDQVYWLAKSFIVLGDSFAERDEVEQAKATFESVRDGYTPSGADDDVLDNVNMRLKKLEEMVSEQN